MKKYNTHFTSIVVVGVLLLTLLTGCYRRALYDDTEIPPIDSTVEQAMINIEIDWTKSDMAPGEASVIFYPEDTKSAPTTVYVTGTKGVAKLKVGKYAVVTFNNKFDDFDGIDFRGTDKYETIGAYIKPITNNEYTPVAGEKVVDNPEMLVSDSRGEFIVTKEMIERTKQEKAKNSKATTAADITLTMKILTIHTKITVHVRNLYLVKKGTQYGVTKGFSEGIMLNNRKTTDVAVTQFAEMPEIEFTVGAYSHGTIKGWLNVFGERPAKADQTQPDTHFALHSLLRDVANTPFVREVEVTNLIEYEQGLGLLINLDIGADAEADNPPIEVPPVDLGDNNGLFDPEIPDWDDEEEIIKPV